MILTLEITGPQTELPKLGATRRKVFKATGGTIGRLPDNYWALPDPYISGRHASIRYLDGVFYIEDTSQNGVCVNSLDNRLVKGQPYALQSGDWIFIEPYEIRASITSPAEETPASPFGNLFAVSPQPDRSGQSDSRARQSLQAFEGRCVECIYLDIRIGLEPIRDDELDRMKEEFDFKAKRPRSDAHKAGDLAGKSTLNDNFQPPRSFDAPPDPSPREKPPFVPPDIPPDYNPFEDSGVVPRPEPVKGQSASPVSRPRVDQRPPVEKSSEPPSPPVKQAPPEKESDVSGRKHGGVDLRAVLRGAGLENVEMSPELAHNFGEILRVVVAGVMDVLQARRDVKIEFRMDVTTYQQKGNNPLKYSVNVDDALHNLLVKRNPAYLGPVEAFKDAFDDVRNHQMAMLAGMRVAFEAMLAEFDPERLQTEFDRQLKKGALLSVPAKLRYWELYRAKFHDMVRDSEKCYRELFGDEFAEAYEEQLKRLAGQGREPKR